MANIQLNEVEFAVKMMMSRTSAQLLLSTQIDTPTSSSSSQALETFMEKLTSVGVLIAQYKSILQSDLAAVQQVKQEIVEADIAAGENFN